MDTPIFTDHEDRPVPHAEPMQPPYDAVIFDMDGVVTDTAATHAAAWKLLFDAVLADPRAGDQAQPPFDAIADYRRYVDGRRREDGVAAFLAARGITVPDGEPADPADAWTVHALATRKNDIFLNLLATDGVRVFPGTAALVSRLREAGTPLGLVTASRNAKALLSAAGLADAFHVVIDGEVSAALDLAGKPDPATFLAAARQLGVAPARAAVIEDAVAGVAAARAGEFGLVVAIDRAGQREELERAGADFVLDDVAELDLGSRRSDPWLLVYEGFDPAHETHREALTTLGNGYLATRGAMPEHVDDGVHYPGVYLAGVYNRLTSDVDGGQRVDEELVNAPNWLPTDLAIDGAWWSAGALTEHDHHRELDLRRGLLTRTVRLVSPEGRAVQVVQRRVVSMDRPHLAALETTITPDGWSGQLSIHTGIDTSVVNGNLVESRLLTNRHLSESAVEHRGNTLLAEVETTQSKIRIATAAQASVRADASVEPTYETVSEGRHMLRFDRTVTAGEPIVLDKIVAVVTSRDPAIASPRDGALAELARTDHDFDELLRRHTLALHRLWDQYAVDLDADDPVQLTVNLHVFHMLQAISPHTADLDAGVPARGLHGEGYRGHVFWDELFVLPLYVMRTPAIARSLLDYRWRRLDAARQAARSAGHPGAMFPWQSGSEGREETPERLYNPLSRQWIDDVSSWQRHVGLDIAYNVWQYYQATADTLWFATRGAELIIEITRYIADLAVFDEADGRFHIRGIVGPDEYHTAYPDAPHKGLNDNAYTNVLAAWVCQRAVESLSALSAHDRDELTERIGLRPDEPERWTQLASRIAVSFHAGMICQFDGYCDLLELDWDHYRHQYGNIERLDLILQAEGDSTNRYRLAKQADVLMLLYLLGPAEVIGALGRLGYVVTTDDLARTAEYYLARTAHGSTLSRVVHASVLATLDRSTAWSEFREALDADLDDTQGGTTGNGIHLGAMAGTVDIVLRTFTGLRMEADALTFRPRPPGALRAVTFAVRYRDLRIRVTMDQHRLTLVAAPGAVPPVRVVVDGVAALLGAGESAEFPIRHAHPSLDVVTADPERTPVGTGS